MSDHAKTKRGDVVYTPSWAVCACLDETGSRTVTVWERCERCHAFMRMPDALSSKSSSALPDDLPAQEPPAECGNCHGKGVHRTPSGQYDCLLCDGTGKEPPADGDDRDA